MSITPRDSQHARTSAFDFSGCLVVEAPACFTSVFLLLLFSKQRGSSAAEAAVKAALVIAVIGIFVVAASPATAAAAAAMVALALALFLMNVLPHLSRVSKHLAAVRLHGTTEDSRGHRLSAIRLNHSVQASRP